MHRSNPGSRARFLDQAIKAKEDSVEREAMAELAAAKSAYARRDMLEHLGLPTDPPLVARARSPSFEAA